MSTTRADWYEVKISNDSLSVYHGHFTGDVTRALKFIKDFCASNKVTYESYGHGYGAITIKGQTHEISPYGIDLSMMIGFCGGKEATFSTTAATTVSQLSLFTASTTATQSTTTASKNVDSTKLSELKSPKIG